MSQDKTTPETLSEAFEAWLQGQGGPDQATKYPTGLFCPECGLKELYYTESGKYHYVCRYCYTQTVIMSFSEFKEELGDIE